MLPTLLFLLAAQCALLWHVAMTASYATAALVLGACLNGAAMALIAVNVVLDASVIEVEYRDGVEK